MTKNILITIVSIKCLDVCLDIWGLKSSNYIEYLGGYYEFGKRKRDNRIQRINSRKKEACEAIVAIINKHCCNHK